MRRILVLLAVAAAVGCAGNTDRSGASTVPGPSASACKLTPLTRHQLAVAYRDLGRLKALAGRQTKFTEMGTPALQEASGRFADDLTGSRLDPFRQNRMIDLGISAAVPVCGQCFQILEAARPNATMKFEPSSVVHC